MIGVFDPTEPGIKPFLTVFTPTYNRANHLNTLYDSLLSQTCRDFEFILVDDGSADGTEAEVSRLQASGNLAIRYVRKSNGGLHTALNAGLALATGELFLYLGSDCWLLPDAVARARDEWKKIAATEKFGGMAFRKIDAATGKKIGSPVPDGILDASHVDAHFRIGIGGDKAEFWRTDLLRAWPYPEIPGENYFPVGHPYDILSRKYILRYFDEATYVGQYLPGGLSSNFPERLRANPKGFLEYYAFLVKYPGLPLKRKAGWLYRIAQCRAAIARRASGSRNANYSKGKA